MRSTSHGSRLLWSHKHGYANTSRVDVVARIPGPIDVNELIPLWAYGVDALMTYAAGAGS